MLVVSSDTEEQGWQSLPQGKNDITARRQMSLKAQSICFSQLKRDRLGEQLFAASILPQEFGRLTE